MNDRISSKESLSSAAMAWESLSREQRQEIRKLVFEFDMDLEWDETMSCLVLVKHY